MLTDWHRQRFCRIYLATGKPPALDNAQHEMTILLVALLVVAAGAPGAVAQQVTDESASRPEFELGFDPSRVATSQLAYTDGTTELQGYLAYDNTTAARRPAVVILPDWDGIGPYEEWRAHLLATLGYTALVADIFSTAVQQGPSLPTAQRSQLTRSFSSDPALYVARIHAALDAVREQDTVDTTRLAAIGYCFGGGGIVQLHHSWPNNTDGLLGVAGFHSSLPTQFPSDPAPNNPIRALFFNGFNDQGSAPEDVTAFEASLNATNASWAFVQFGQTVHAFTEPTMEIVATNVPAANGGYNPNADYLSWWTLRGFLRDIFGTVDMSNSYTEDVAAGEELDLASGDIVA